MENLQFVIRLVLLRIVTIKVLFLIIPLYGYAQVSLNNHNTYVQTFNTLTTSSAQVAFVNNSTLPGWYLQHESYNLPSYGISANDGTNTTRNFYSLGTQGSTDRALGGMATDVNSGSGYIGLRVRNNTGATIRNFEISYAMEQWYNSGNEAKFDFSYTTKPAGTAITSLLENTSVWINIDALDAVTPSTSSPVGSKNGNADAHRIVKRFTINEINLQANQEIMLRWQYITVNATNGNGLAIDDVSITPQVNVFYAAASGDLDNKATWARNQNGSGGGPTDFSLQNQVFHITKGGGRLLKGSMNMTGTNSKVVLGDGINSIDVRINASSAFTGRIDVTNHATLHIENAASPVLGNLAENSTVIYSNPNSNATQSLTAAVYGNLKLEGKSKKLLSANILINGDLVLDESHLEIGNYNITLHKLKTIQGGNERGYIKTNGSGRLILTVPRTNKDIIFPIGNSTYNPVVLKQSATGAEDEFRVRVIDGIFSHYDHNDLPAGNVITERAINRTWVIEENTAGGSDLFMKLFWKPSSQLTEFNDETAYIAHYENDAWDEVQYQSSENIDGLKSISRNNIRSFSPFGIFSFESPLPVALLSFAAVIQDGHVLVEWQTSSEKQNDFFTLESSTDAVTYDVIAQIPGAGNSYKIRNYEFVDQGKPTGKKYYRLKQTDFGGSFSYSSIISVEMSSTFRLHVYPSPARNIIHIKGNISGTDDIEMRIMDMYGKNYSVTPEFISEDMVTINLESFPSNSYILKLKQGDRTAYLKFIKI